MQRKSKSNTYKDNFRELLNFVSDSIMVFNREGVVLAANKTASVLLGLKVEELVGNSIEDLKIIDEKTKVFLKNQLQKRIKGETIENSEIPVRINGETRYFESKGNRIDYFGEPADLLILQDVTTTRKCQTKLLEKMDEIDEQRQTSEEKYKKLFQESMDAIFVGEAETGIIVDCNAAALALVGREKSELIGQRQSILHPKWTIEDGFSRDFRSHREGKK